MNSPLLLGITGGIGSGKSTLCRVFQVLGVPVYNSDERAKALLVEDEQLKQQLIRAFGTAAYTTDGLPDRQFLAQTVFSNSTKLEQLNALVHPAVGRDFKDWIGKRMNYPYLIKEAALIFETGIYQSLDYTLLVIAPLEIRMQRVLKRDPQRSEEQVRDIMDKQLPDRDKEKLASFVLRNDDSILLIPEILKIDNFLKLRATKAGPQEA